MCIDVCIDVCAAHAQRHAHIFAIDTCIDMVHSVELEQKSTVNDVKRQIRPHKFSHTRMHRGVEDTSETAEWDREIETQRSDQWLATEAYARGS